jgi:Zn-dependent peptidase ImmA (M78 family)
MTEDLRWMDVEANAFAMELLMPTEWLMRDLGPSGIDIEDEKRMGALAKRYRVSLPVMIARIAMLRFAS